jgi:hypothetical protein
MRNLVLTISALVALSVGAVPAANAVTISLVPEQGPLQTGGTGLFDVVASGLSASTGVIGAYDVSVTFNPSLLSWSSTTFGSGLDVNGLGDFQDSGLVKDHPEILDTGENSFDSPADLEAKQPGSFVLFSIALRGIANGTSALTLNLGSLSDENGNALTANLQSSSVTVTPVPLPAAGWLLLSGLGSMFGLGPVFNYRRWRRTPG